MSSSNSSDFLTSLEGLSDKLRGAVRDAETRASKWKHETGARLQWRGGFTAPLEQPLPLWPKDMPVSTAISALELISVVVGESQTHSSIPLGVILLVAANCVPFVKPGGVLGSQHCLSPWCVVAKKQYFRLASSAFIHRDPVHLMGNMTALLYDGSYLERQSNLPSFLATTTAVSVLSSALYVGVTYLMAKHTGYKAEYYSMGVVGFSGAGVALSAISGHRRGGKVEILGSAVAIPSEFNAWVQVLQSQILAPRSSFTDHDCRLLLLSVLLWPLLLGHMCGAVVGVLWAYVPRALSCVVTRRGGAAAGGGAGGQAYVRNGQIYRPGSRGGRGALSEAAAVAKRLGMHGICAAGCLAVQWIILSLKNRRSR